MKRYIEANLHSSNEAEATVKGLTAIVLSDIMLLMPLWRNR